MPTKKQTWRYSKLGEICFTTSGGTPSRGDKSYYNGSIPWVKSGELGNGLILDTEEKITEAAIANSSAKIFPKGTLLIALYGATIGKLAFLGINAATNQAVCGIFQNDNIDSWYLYNFLLYKRSDLINQGIGGAQPNISQAILKNLEIPLPSVELQKLIVSKIESLFSELDKAVESLKTAQQQLKTYRQSVLKWAFEGRLTNENVKEGELPEGWVKKLISEVAKIKGGKRLPKNHSYADERTSYLYIMAGNLKEGTVVNPSTYIHKRTFDTLINYQVTGGEVYITIVGACIGDAGIIPDNLGNAILTENAAKIIELQAINNKYLALYINSEQCQADIKRKILSATLGKLALNRIGSLEIPVPPIKEQVIIVREIESRLSVADKMEESITESLQQAEALRQSILKKAFEGKLV